MELIIVVSAFAVLPGAIIAAVIGWKALAAEPIDHHRLVLAWISVSLPWMGMVLAGDAATARQLRSRAALGGAYSVSPIVALALAARWVWLRFPPRTSVPAAVIAATTLEPFRVARPRRRQYERGSASDRRTCGAGFVSASLGQCCFAALRGETARRAEAGGDERPHERESGDVEL